MTLVTRLQVTFRTIVFSAVINRVRILRGGLGVGFKQNFSV